MRPGAALVGTAELDQFVLRDAPALAKLLQAMEADPNRTAAAALKMLLLCGDDTTNGKTRRIVLSRALVALLQAQNSRGVSGWIFPGRDGPDKPIDNLTKPFNRMLKAAGLEKAQIHDLIHTHASMLLASGGKRCR